jgi:hypothetical protein
MGKKRGPIHRAGQTETALREISLRVISAQFPVQRAIKVCGDDELSSLRRDLIVSLSPPHQTTKAPDLAANVAGRVRDISQMEGQWVRQHFRRASTRRYTR